MRRKRGGPPAKTTDVPKSPGRPPVVSEPGDVPHGRLSEGYDTAVTRTVPAPAPVPTSEAVDAPDIAADIEKAVAELAAQGTEVTLPAVGELLSERWGMNQYRKITAKRKLRSLAEHHGWQVDETRPGVLCLWRPDAAATGQGG